MTKEEQAEIDYHYSAERDKQLFQEQPSSTVK